MNELINSHSIMPHTRLTAMLEISGFNGTFAAPCSFEQAIRFRTERMAVISEVLGVSYDEYLAWLYWLGRAQCEAAAGKNKRRCRCTVSGVQFGHPLLLARYPGGYCERHEKKLGAR